MKTPDEEHFRKQRKDHVERMMKGYNELIAIGYLVPVRDADGQPVIRDGEPVYTRTEDPKILEKFPDLGNN